MNERQLIELLTRSLATNESVVVGAGDDCAVLDLGLAERFLLFKTDAVVEGVHFTREAEPEKIGRKAVARCLSDIAAMAGAPQAAVVTLGLPTDFDAAFLERMYAGMNALARECELAIVGGETTRNSGGIFVSVAMVGTVARERCAFRSGARAGDALFVTGELGGSMAGRHFEFEPRLREAQWLAMSFDIHAMIDVSDGLAADLPHILKASNVGAELLESAIPISRAARLRHREGASQKPPLLAALTDGEDFELLFTVASGHAVAVLDGFKETFPGTRLSCIGKVTGEPGLRLREQAGVRLLVGHGYDHFQQS